MSKPVTNSVRLAIDAGNDAIGRLDLLGLEYSRHCYRKAGEAEKRFGMRLLADVEREIHKLEELRLKIRGEMYVLDTASLRPTSKQ